MKDASLPSDLRGASRLAIDLTLLVTDVVETMHHNIVARPGILGKATLAPTEGLTGFVYRRVRGVTRVVGSAIDTALAPLCALDLEAPEWPGRDAVIGALNGVVGDHLEASGNPLAIAMQLRVDGNPMPLVPGEVALRLVNPKPRIIVMVHGLCMTDSAWKRGAHDHGQALARDLDAQTLYVRYNTGRHISTNGAELAALLESVIAAWPVDPDDVVLIGHSMGGLVIRSACASAEAAGHAWLRRLSAIVFLGTPHHGAPLERGGHGVDLLLGASPYTIAFARLGRFRSVGITDLRHGSVGDEDWRGRDRFARGGDVRRARPLPRGVEAFAIAGSLGKHPSSVASTPRGDGLVTVASALGRHRDRRLALGISVSRRWIAYGTGHLDLLDSKTVYARIKGWLSTPH